VIYAPDVWQTREFQGVLATSWEYSNDMKTWTFHLRQGVKFHDGTPWDAKVAKWNANLFIMEKTSATFNDLDTINLPDDYTIQYNFKSPKPTFIVEVATGDYFISPTSYEKSGAEQKDRKAWAIEHPVGTGPFKFVGFMRGNYVKYERFDDYWGGKPYLDKVEYRIVPDATVSAAMMEKGEADMYVYAELKQSLDLDKKPGFTARFCKHHTLEGVWFEAKDPNSVFYDKRVREAFEYAVNREPIVKALALGCPDVEIMYQMPIPGALAYRPDFGRKYDVAKAKQLMADAGKSSGFTTTIYSASATPRWGDLAIMLQAYLEEINVKLKIEYISPGQYMTYLLFGWPVGTLFISGIPNEPIPTHTALMQYRCSAPGVPRWNYSTASTPEMCALFDAMVNSTSMASAEAAYVKLMQKVMDESVGIFIMDWPDTAVYADYVHTNWISYSTKVWDASKTWMEAH
jgi:peptide/nickel transport system substrate-binding protein